MATVEVKYRYGDRVSCHGVNCIITGIIIRGGGGFYELGFRNNDGQPTGCTAQECEITSIGNSSLGFKR